MLVRGDTVALAAVRDGDDLVAIGRGAVVDGGEHGGWLGVNAVETAPGHRRRGLASDVLAALVDWARGHGADRAFLQVDLANDVARTVYERAGFVAHHTYDYLQAPRPPAGGA
nr:GNAT family N-acetyltransferase [Salsipaludibacter albus]